MAGIYIHIPFCERACSYCDFHFRVNKPQIPAMVDAIKNEIKLKAEILKSRNFDSVYFGGGTPSILGFRQIEALLNALHENVELSGQAEITLEANPEHINDQSLENLKSLGINRLSVGIQSFSDKVLSMFNRGHDERMALRSLQSIKDSSFTNYNLDLIFGAPIDNENPLNNDLEIFKDWEPPHISAYALTIEEGTKFGNQFKAGLLMPKSDEAYYEDFEKIHNELTSIGYEHYEISNFAKPGMHSFHNKNYWLNEEYIGIGPSAHSFFDQKRFWNINSNTKYIQAINNQIIPEEMESLNKIERINEYIMTSLRTINGLDFRFLESTFNLNMMKKKNKELESIIGQSLGTLEDQTLKLSLKGWFLSDSIISNLFFEKEEIMS